MSTAPTGVCDPDVFSEDPEEYNLGLHVGGVFIVFGVSFLGAIGSILIGSSERLKNNVGFLTVLQVCKFFGIGVVAATAWIHIIPDAFEVFSHTCIQSDPIWSQYGTAWVGLFALIAGFLVQGLEFGLLSRVKQHQHDHSHQQPKTDTSGLLPQHHHQHKEEEVQNQNGQEENLSLHDVGGHAHSVAHAMSADGMKDIGTFMLELGILVHSVVIGISLGVATDEFTSLLIAICFHQLFEGMALGTRISELERFKGLSQRIGLGMFYPITTPIGIAIGLLAQGILDSLSAGILMYNAYVELMAMEMNHSSQFRSHSPRRKTMLFIAMYCGAAAMAIIGLWA